MEERIDNNADKIPFTIEGTLFMNGKEVSGGRENLL